MFLINVEKETTAIVLMYFLPEVLFKKIKTALRIAFSWIVKKKIKKTHSALQFSDLLQETDLFFFFWPKSDAIKIFSLIHQRVHTSRY